MPIPTAVGRRCLLLVTSLALLSFGSGVSQPEKPSADAPTNKAPTLLFLIEQMGGMNDDGSGVVLAGWSDGMVVAASDPRRPDKLHRFGMVAPERVRWAIGEIKSAGFFEEQRKPGLWPDSTMLSITATSDGKVVTHECQWKVYPPGASATSDQKEYQFAKMWATTQVALAFTRSADFKMVNKEEAAQKRLDKVTRERVGKP